jgi:hypothetical protein
MNVATKQILRWFLVHQGMPAKDIDVLVYTLAAGIAKGEADSLQTAARMLAAADQAAANTDDASLIARLFELHFEMQGLGVAQKKLDALIELQSIVAAPSRGPIAERIRNWRTETLVKEIGEIPAFQPEE